MANTLGDRLCNGAKHICCSYCGGCPCSGAKVQALTYPNPYGTGRGRVDYAVACSNDMAQAKADFARAGNTDLRLRSVR